MPRRSTAEIESEIARLAPAVEVLASFIFDSAAEEGVDIPPPEPIDAWITRLRAGGVPASQILRGIEEAIQDQTSVFLCADPRDIPEQERLLAFYRAATGRYLFDDVPDPRRKLRRILDRGHLRNRTEWRLITGLLSDAEQSVFDAGEMQKLLAMAAAFEATNKGS